MNNQQQYDLIVRAQAGDSDAMEALFSEYYNNVYYFALKTVKDPDLACDITQETFVEIIRTIGDLKEPAAFMTWMKQITYHQCTRYFRKKKDVLLEEDEDEEGNSLFDTLADEGAVPQEILEKEEFRQTILDMIDQLSEEQRSAVLLYYFEEMTVPQIAEVQGVSEGTVKSRLNYARKAIKKSVEGYEQKTGIKLHSVAILPLIMLYFGTELMPAAEAAKIQSVVIGAMGTKAAVATTTTTAATTATTATATTATTATAATATTATTATATAAATTAATATVTSTAATAAAATAATGGALAAKITAGVVLAALAVGSAGVATGVIPTPWTNQEIIVEDNRETEGTTATEATLPEQTVPTETDAPTIPAKQDYSSDLVGILTDMQDVQETFADFPSNRVTYFLSKDGKLMTRKSPHTAVDFGENADSQESLIVGQYPLYKDSQNVYHMHTGSSVITLSAVAGTPVAIVPTGEKDADTGETVITYYAVLSLSQGQLYYNRFNAAGQKTEFDNTPVQLYVGSEQGSKLENVSWLKEVMNPGSGWSFRFSADGMIYKANKITTNLREGDAVCLVEATGIAEANLLSDAGNPSLIYKVAEQENAIYVDGTAVSLPQGKTAADVKSAVGVQTGLVFFTDGTVYAYDQTGMTHIQELTELNQNGSIRKVFTAYTNAQNIFLILDNNLTYVLK